MNWSGTMCIWKHVQPWLLVLPGFCTLNDYLVIYGSKCTHNIRFVPARVTHPPRYSYWVVIHIGKTSVDTCLHLAPLVNGCHIWIKTCYNTVPSFFLLPLPPPLSPPRANEETPWGVLGWPYRWRWPLQVGDYDLWTSRHLLVSHKHALWCRT